MSLFLSDLARADLDEAWQYIAADSEDAADRVIDDIVSTFQLLIDTPRAGRERAELAADLRSFPCGSYVIFYRPAPEGVAVARVLHGNRDVERQPFPDEQ
jgi:toxin ParE1/3/4